MNWFKRKKSPLKLFREQKSYPVEAAFELGGVTYYRFCDTNNIPGGRNLAAIPLFIELATNCDRDYLQKFVEAMEKVLGDQASISIEKLITLKNQIKDRLQWAFTPDLVYKYASVMYFDESENPEHYDEAYAVKKIARWKASQDMKTFFLTEPIQSLLPSLSAASASFQMYSDVILKAQAYQLSVLSDILSTSRTSEEEKTNLSSATTIQKKSALSGRSPRMNTSSSSTAKRNTSKK